MPLTDSLSEMNPEQVKQQNSILKVLCAYLLLERKQETQLSMAFSILVQERHNQFHTLGNHKEGDDSSFADCSNEMCTAAFNVLKDSRSMAIEVNDLTIQMIADYDFTITGSKSTCRAWLASKEAKSPKLVIPGGL